MAITKKEAQNLARKAILSAEKFGFPLPSKKGKKPRRRNSKKVK